MPNVHDELVDISTMTKALKVSRSFIYELIKSGELPTIKLGRRRLTRPEALRAWLASKEQRAA